MVNIVAEYRLDYTGNNPPIAEGDVYSFLKYADTVGLGDDGRLYLLQDEIKIPIPTHQEDLELNEFTYTNINCDLEAKGDNVTTSQSDAQSDDKTLTFKAANPGAGEKGIHNRPQKGHRDCAWIGSSHQITYDADHIQASERVQHTSAWNVDINLDNNPDYTEMKYTPYTLSWPTGSPLEQSQITPIQSVVYQIAALGN